MVCSGLSVDDIGLEPTTSSMSTNKPLPLSRGKTLGESELPVKLPPNMPPRNLEATLLDVFHQLPQEQQLLLIQLAKNFK